MLYPRVSTSGLIFGTGEEWKEQRKFAISAFKTLGFGTTRMEKAVLDEVIALTKRLKLVNYDNVQFELKT
jgi:hypothetical protein